MRAKIPYCIYLHLQKKLFEHSERGVIQKTEAISFMHHYRIPKEIRPVVIKEMEHLGLISMENRFTIRIINTDKNRLIELPGELYGKVGLYGNA